MARYCDVCGLEMYNDEPGRSHVACAERAELARMRNAQECNVLEASDALLFWSGWLYPLFGIGAFTAGMMTLPSNWEDVSRIFVSLLGVIVALIWATILRKWMVLHAVLARRIDEKLSTKTS